MTLDQVMGKAAECELEAMQSVRDNVSVKDWAKLARRNRAALRTAIKAYGLAERRAERERAAVVADLNAESCTKGTMLSYLMRSQAEAIRSRPDEPALREQGASA